MWNQHLQFTTEIWTNDTNLPLTAKEDKVQIVSKDKFPFLDMKIIWSPKGDLQLSVFRKNGEQLKYAGTGITHTTVTLRMIPEGVLTTVAKLNSQKTSFSSEGVENSYPDH